MTNIVLTEEEKKAEKICEENAEKSRLFHEKYDKVIDDILHEQDGEQYAHQRGEEDKGIAAPAGEVGVAYFHHILARPVHNRLQKHRRQAAQDAHNHA